MSAVLAETLVWTGVLIAAVLVLRRPVTQMCGPQCAYALWALPLLRLMLPPLTLPAWMAPAWMVPAQPAAAPFAPDQGVVLQAEAMPAPIAADSGFDVFAAITTLPLVEALLLVWLGGAGVFLWRRFAAYFVLRDDLLAKGREVGRVPARFGTIRLVETPGTQAPIAFGVIDPVIALPPGFMALPDRHARDLALAHELAHHRGLDLVVNVLVQPLFALHWFNPLGHYGWLALRRDQEAACDARVIAERSAEERAAYARLIAGFAASPNLAPNAAITAPMACPVLGEKSIIHRLRSLSMSQMSPRRRYAGRALLAAGMLALPLTATISYAASEAQAEAPAPPAPPAPSAVRQAPDAPQVPTPPEAPAAPEVPDTRATFMLIDPDSEFDEVREVVVTEKVERGADGKERRMRVVRRTGPDGETLTEDVRPHMGLQSEEREVRLIELRKGLAEAEKALAEMPDILATALAEAEAARASAAQQRLIVKRGCRPGSAEVAETIENKDGTRAVIICQRRVFASARNGLKEARDEIASDSSIPEETRTQLIKELDRQIARWSEKEG